MNTLHIGDDNVKRIKLYAYWAQNLGDDLMVHILLKRYPQYQFLCENWDSYSNKFNTYSNFLNAEGIQKKYGRLNHIFNILTLYRKRDFFLTAIKKKLSSIACSVYIGGSLYMQEENVEVEHRVLVEEQKLKQPPLFIIGANFGPYITEKFKDVFSGYFRKCGGITFRDKTSYEMFCENENVAYAPDVVFNLKIPNRIENSQKVLISVLDVSTRKKLCNWEKIYYSRIAEVCELCIAKGKIPILMSFCKKEGDEAAVQKVINMLPSDQQRQTQAFLYNGNIDAALELFRTADCVIATRFHAMILALRFGKPVYCISYDQKVKNVLQDMSLSCYCEMKDLELVSAQEMFDKCSTANVEEYVRMADRQFALFEEYIEDVK